MNIVSPQASKIKVSMNRKLFATAVLFFLGWSLAWADPAIESAQQKLKDGGFYYGDINGQKDADTTAAIRRYQIRNGLQITGELNAETLSSLGLRSKPGSTPAPRPAQTPGPPPPDYPQPTPAPRTTPAPRPESNDDYESAPEPPPPHLERGNLFEGTPYEAAPPQVQQEIVFKAQLILMRAGFYREEIDGLYGPAMNFALRNYQGRFGLQPSGRFDVETLGSLGLLPEQRTTGIHRSHRRFFWPGPPRFWRPDEPVYIPR
jgi:peptidoglycan hydrolase-like protein with peptidoglycan-binding domain